MAETIVVDGREVALSSQDRPYFPESNLTKGDLVGYYRRIAPTMLPYLRDRPLSMQRFPQGIDAEGFYQKEAPDHFPEWIALAEVEVLEQGVTQRQVICNDAATLVYLANFGTITPHVWLSRVPHLNMPDRLIFDLDPPGGRFDLVREAARLLREALDAHGLASFLMTTGSRGLHVLSPLEPLADFDVTRDFARDLADELAADHPDRFTTETRKDKRGDRLFLDYLRNAYAQTAVAPYAVRAKPGAPIATPIDWRELDDGALHSQRYTMQNIFRRLGQKADPWQALADSARPLPV